MFGETHIIFVATKCDLGCSYEKEEVLNMMEKENASYVEISSKTGQNVQQLLARII